jgi:hypothetical protein
MRVKCLDVILNGGYIDLIYYVRHSYIYVNIHLQIPLRQELTKWGKNPKKCY